MTGRSSGHPAAGSASSRSGTPRRELVGVVLASVVGAALVWYAAGRVWAVTVTARPEPLPDLRVVRTGADVLPWLPALALVGVAGAGAVLATRGLVRQAVGVLLTASGATMAVGGAVAVGGVAGDGPAAGAVGWPLLAVIGAGLTMSAGVATALRGPRWPSMGARYDRPGPAGRTSPVGDRGHDGRQPGRDPEPATGLPATGLPERERGGRTTTDAWDALDRGEDPTVD
ncbi:Trp biosynthesis-associated membrane protein [Solwaraspora sp. WMMD406]|uniref:Trp biosynthesis-associated membrane protein n=1 Tax=Solwaraspora sp. WMMD406 TaxID=3016095 RepID=UPI002417AA39|nr:Trp biosynthesis-associated membrane protein [Solwaraspora sp. WMMD406]MDG4765389.1 Trp biosynthesis-associated membrane protein [Solwaraspora sp. WMMD406]